MYQKQSNNNGREKYVYLPDSCAGPLLVVCQLLQKEGRRRQINVFFCEISLLILIFTKWKVSPNQPQECHNPMT
jgi:hypothetical protein